MKKATTFLLGLIIVLLQGCSGSETYRGLWKATNPKGDRFEITFSAKSISIKDSIGKANTYNYRQHSISIENSIETYGIRLGDGREYSIHFPIANDESKGIISDAGGKLLYTISRKEFIKYEDIYGLNK